MRQELRKRFSQKLPDRFKASIISNASERENVAVIGGGQAGLGVSYFLRRCGIPHIGFSWVDLPIFYAPGKLRHARGVTAWGRCYGPAMAAGAVPGTCCRCRTRCKFRRLSGEEITLTISNEDRQIVSAPIGRFQIQKWPYITSSTSKRPTIFFGDQHGGLTPFGEGFGRSMAVRQQSSRSGGEGTPANEIAAGKTPPRKIIHIDMDAFFASIEQRDNPELRDRPVAVGSSSARGVVAAASYEARRYGVRSAMPSVTAKRRCPNLIFVKPRFEVYKQVSHQFQAILNRFTPIVEPLSLDEAYLDVTENLKGLGSASEIAKDIKAAIRAETGLTASAGVSYNKFLAKLASGHKKPDGLCVITPERGPVFIETLPVRMFHGVGPATAAKMERLGIYTGLDLRACELPFLIKSFGKTGRFYYSISRGIDERPVCPNRTRQSVGAENTFLEDLRSFEAMCSALLPLAAKVWRHCEGANVRGRTVTLKVKYSDFQTVTRSQTFAAPIAREAELHSIGASLLAQLIPITKGVRLLGVSLSNLQAAGALELSGRQMSLEF
jgi:DNA polymerase IV